MTKPIPLSVHRNTKQQRERHEVRDKLRAAVKEHLRSADYDGFALVSFRHDPDGLATRTHYYTRDARDSYVLPDIAKSAIRRLGER